MHLFLQGNDFHFELGGEQGETSFDFEDCIPWNSVLAKQLYEDFSKSLEENLQLKTDLHQVQPKVGKQNIARYLKTQTEANVLLITVSYDLMVFNKNVYDAIINVAKDEVDYAQSIGKKIILSVECSSNEGDKVSFAEEGRSVLKEELLKIKQILKGDTQIVCDLLMDEMQALAMEMRFEEAQAIKEKYDLIENYRAKSEVVSRIIHNVDVFSIEMDEGSAYINYLHITNGCVNQAFTFEYKKRLNETKEELLQLGIVEMRERYKSKSREIIVPFELEMELNGVSFIVPQRGEKKHLLELSILNVKQYKVDRLKQADKLNPEQKKTRILKEIQEQLHLPKIPAHIECFDNSNIQGSDAVAACVVFKMGKPSKQDYRKFNIKTVEGADDYASMKEVVRRRYTRAIEEQSPLPDLIITDGGKGQMEVVREVIEDELNLQIPIAGLAKDNKHRTSELLYGFPPMTIGVKQSTPLFHLLENIQNEVHRFAITFHRDKRSKSQTASVLDDMPGIGEKRKAALLKAFKSVSRIKKASIEEIAEVIGISAAKNLKEKLKE